MNKVKYDVAIIGAGIGGLTAASLLTQSGYKVLVVEQVSFVGGRGSTLEYKGFKLPTGFVWASDEIHGALCRELGVPLELHVLEPSYFYLLGGKYYEAPIAGIHKALITQASRDEKEAEKE